MATASLDNVKKRVIAILNANPGAFSASVSGDVGAFPSNDEITLAIFEADEHIVTKGYFSSVNPALGKDFRFLAVVAHGDEIPFHYGKPGKVELSSDEGATWNKGIEAAALDDITNAIASADIIGDGAFDHLYKISNNNFYAPCGLGRIEIQTFTRTNQLQAKQSEETLITATAIRFLTKHASPAAFDVWAKESFAGLTQLIQDGAYQPPENMEG